MGGSIESKTKISRNFGATKMENIIIHCGYYRMPNSFSNRLCWLAMPKLFVGLGVNGPETIKRL
jgi:hypothetical protein